MILTRFFAIYFTWILYTENDLYQINTITKLLEITVTNFQVGREINATSLPNDGLIILLIILYAGYFVIIYPIIILFLHEIINVALGEVLFYHVARVNTSINLHLSHFKGIR